MRHSRFWYALSRLLCLVLFCGCVADAGGKTELGSLALALTTQAGGVTFRLANARFMLKGPENRGLASDGADTLSVELPAGPYTLELLEGWSLMRVDDAGGPLVEAKLVSENPVPLLVSAGETTHTTLRFELAQGSGLATGTGTLEVELDVGGPDGGSGTPVNACSAGLRIDEVDYDQEGTDQGEFVEIVNVADCDAVLAGVTLELVNGGDGKTYAHYALSDASSLLASGERLVIGDANVLAGLPDGVARQTMNGSGMQNGPDGVRLTLGTNVLDAFAYEGPVAGAGEGTPVGEDAKEQAFARCPGGFDSDANALDFRLTTPTPGAANACAASSKEVGHDAVEHQPAALRNGQAVTFD